MTNTGITTNSTDNGRHWRQQIIRFAGLDPDGRLVPMTPRKPPEDLFAANDRAFRDAEALHRALKWTWK